MGITSGNWTNPCHLLPRVLASWHPDHQRHVRYLAAQFVGSFQELPVLAEHRAMVGHEDDDRILEQSELADRIQQAANPMIHATHGPRVVRPHPTLDFVGERNRFVGRFDVARRCGAGQVLFQETAGRVPRLVGIEELHVEVEGPLLMVVVQPANGGLRCNLADGFSLLQPKVPVGLVLAQEVMKLRKPGQSIPSKRSR